MGKEKKDNKKEKEKEENRILKYMKAIIDDFKKDEEKDVEDKK